MASSAPLAGGEKKEESKIAAPSCFVPLFFDVQVTGATDGSVGIRDPYWRCLSWRIHAPKGASSKLRGLIVSVDTHRGGWTSEGLARVDVVSINGDTTKGTNTPTYGLLMPKEPTAIKKMKKAEVIHQFHAFPYESAPSRTPTTCTAAIGNVILFPARRTRSSYVLLISPFLPS